MKINLLWLAAWVLATPTRAAETPCLRLAGVVQDYATRQPLAATLFLKTPTGRLRVAPSAEGSGAFSIEIRCPATDLLIERSGYRPQSMPLPPAGAPAPAAPVMVLIPLVAVDGQALDRPYQQSEQKFYEQNTKANPGNRPQVGTFVVVDALSGTPLRAQTCFFSTNTNLKRCLDTDGRGQFETRFEQQDILAMEVAAPGYQTYLGNLNVEHLDGRHLRHDIRLLRQLTLLALNLDGPDGAGAHCELRSDGGGKTIALSAVPGGAGWFCAYDLLPQRYQLVVRATDGRELRREPITVQPGLNPHRVVLAALVAARPPAPVVRVASPPPPAPTGAAPRRQFHLPGELPLVYFDQGSYLLDEGDKDVLRQVGDFLRQHPEYRVKLVGHTNPEGDERLNRYLAEFRAQVIANFLHWEGVPDGRVTISGQGSRYPVSPSDSDENKALNRRVFLKLEVVP